MESFDIDLMTSSNRWRWERQRNKVAEKKTSLSGFFFSIFFRKRYGERNFLIENYLTSNMNQSFKRTTVGEAIGKRENFFLLFFFLPFSRKRSRSVLCDMAVGKESFSILHCDFFFLVLCQKTARKDLQGNLIFPKEKKSRIVKFLSLF